MYVKLIWEFGLAFLIWIYISLHVVLSFIKM